MVGGSCIPVPICLDCAAKTPLNPSSVSVCTRPSLPLFENMAGRLWCHKASLEQARPHTHKHSCLNEFFPAFNLHKCKRPRLSAQEKENMDLNDRPLMMESSPKPLKEIHKNSEKRNPDSPPGHGISQRRFVDLDPFVETGVVAQSHPTDIAGNMLNSPKNYLEAYSGESTPNIATSR